MFLAPSATRAGEPYPIVTASLPAAGGTDTQGRWVTIPQETPPGGLLVLGFAGDLGFSGNDQPLSDAGAVRHGRIIPWDQLFSGIEPLLKVDATFANLETVITDRPDLSPVEKNYNFSASPAGLNAAVKAGINVIAAANNHAADFGEGGIAETLRHLAAAAPLGLKGYAGLGQGGDRYRAGVFDLQGISIGLSAIGKGINPAGPQGFGQPLFASLPDFDRTSQSLQATRADVRVLSVHYGEELILLPEASDRSRLRAAIDQGRATIVFGHHSHVASGVERRGDGLIFYGLGNFLHAGTQNMARYGECRDFGLHARVYLWAAPGSKPVLRAVEVTPIKNMHEIAKPFLPEEAAKRIAVVNAMSDALTLDGGDPLLFAPTDRGSGLACLPGSANYSDDLGTRCRAQSSPLMNVSAFPRVSLESCNPLPLPQLATRQQKTKPAAGIAEEKTNQPEKASGPVKAKQVVNNLSAGETPRSRTPRKQSLFSKAR